MKKETKEKIYKLVEDVYIERVTAAEAVVVLEKIIDEARLTTHRKRETIGYAHNQGLKNLSNGFGHTDIFKLKQGKYCVPVTLGDEDEH
jgi:hypothetical protein